MKKHIKLKRITQTLITVISAVVLFAVGVFAEEENKFLIEARYTLPNGFEYTVESFTKEKTSTDANGVQRYLGTEYTIVLPYGVKNTQVALHFSDNAEVAIDGKNVADGTQMVLEEGVFPMVYNGTEGYFNVMYTSDIPQIYIETKKSREYIESNLDYVDSGTIVITDGIDTYYSGELEKIKGRGNVSWGKDKKPYSIKLAKKTSLFGMEPSKKYNLLANVSDETIIRNKIAIDYGEKTGVDYCAQSQFVDVYFENEYRGCYQITEKVEVGEGRVEIFDIDTITEQSNPGVDLDALEQGGDYEKGAYGHLGSYKWLEVPNDIAKGIQGGYLLELELGERYISAQTGFVTNYGQVITISNPQYASKAQVEYIRNYYQEFEDAVLSGDGYNSLGKHYSEYIDMESMAKMYLLQEFVQNLDAGLTSAFLYKDVNGKLAMCSPWDFDHSLGDKVADHDRDVSDPENIWVAEGTLFGRKHIYTIFSLLWQHADFRAEAVRQWNQVFYPEAEWLLDMTADTAEEINASAIAEYYRWRRTAYIDPQHAEEIYHSEIAYVSDYMVKRFAFLNEFFAEGNITVTYCGNGAARFTADKMPHASGSTVKIKESKYKNEDELGEIEFLGWNTKADGSGTAYQPGDTITVEEDIILYAQWARENQNNTENQQATENMGLFQMIIYWFKNLFK